MTGQKNNSAINQLISLIFTASRQIREREKGSEWPDPFSYLQLQTLSYVAEHKNPPMGNIAEHLRIALPSATSLINRLVKTKCLERTGDKDDRRIVRLAITPKGQKMLRRGFNEIRRRMEKILSRLNESDIKNLIQALKKLSESYKT